MRSSFPGKVNLRWCDACHTPGLAKKCACGTLTREVPVTPPGDARPAFPADIDLVNAIFTEHFGVPIIPPGHLALLNKVPDLDRMDEIVIGGAVVGSIRYLPEKDAWEPIPRPEAAAFLKPIRRYVVVDDGAVSFIREGASVLAPGLVEIEDSVQEGDEVFILTREGTCVGVGRAKVSAAAAREMERGSIVRTRKNILSQPVPGPATWDDAVQANREVIEQTEAAAVHFVREVAEKHELQKTISYSGGKDSLATLLVVMKAIGPHPLLFADTGLEFPETYENVTIVSEKYGLPVIRGSGEEAFWKAYSHQGPPAVNARWCCQVCKLTPVSHAITGAWGECLSYIGQRKYESLKRMMSGRVWKNPKVPNQVAAAPIHHWSALHVWLYIFREKAPYNVLYERRLDRIGCFMCPSSDIALIRYIREEYPELWNGWEKHLVTWQQDHSLPDDWVTMMRWRLREGRTDEVDSNC
ncbi:MAG: phosphoadenosine phosphosulfate reductase family protein [Methanoregulaceae archaeon]